MRLAARCADLKRRERLFDSRLRAQARVARAGKQEGWRERSPRLRPPQQSPQGRTSRSRKPCISRKAEMGKGVPLKTTRTYPLDRLRQLGARLLQVITKFLKGSETSTPPARAYLSAPSSSTWLHQTPVGRTLAL
jgi:hypothetical protein